MQFKSYHFALLNIMIFVSTGIILLFYTKLAGLSWLSSFLFVSMGFGAICYSSLGIISYIFLRFQKIRSLGSLLSIAFGSVEVYFGITFVTSNKRILPFWGIMFCICGIILITAGIKSFYEIENVKKNQI